MLSEAKADHSTQLVITILALHVTGYNDTLGHESCKKFSKWQPRVQIEHSCQGHPLNNSPHLVEDFVEAGAIYAPWGKGSKELA